MAQPRLSRPKPVIPARGVLFGQEPQVLHVTLPAFWTICEATALGRYHVRNEPSGAIGSQEPGQAAVPVFRQPPGGQNASARWIEVDVMGNLRQRLSGFDMQRFVAAFEQPAGLAPKPVEPVCPVPCSHFMASLRFGSGVSSAK